MTSLPSATRPTPPWDWSSTRASGPGMPLTRWSLGLKLTAAWALLLLPTSAPLPWRALPACLSLSGAPRR
eukprot:947009-Lingulodinium_polyedra.AAC.1